MCVAMIGIIPIADTPTAETTTPSPSTSAYRSCPLTTEAQAVKTPVATLPAAPSRDPASQTIGGTGLATTGLVLSSQAPELPSNLAARAWLVADLDTGAVLGSCGPHDQHAPASVQKLLLAATLLDKLDPAQVVEITADDLDIESGSSAVGLVVGGKYTVETLWLGLFLVSGNDAARALARIGGGDAGVEGTIQAMNALASELGAKDTTAVTPNGLDAAGQFTTVYDLALIGKACLERADFQKYALAETAAIPAQTGYSGFQIQNENKLVTQYEGFLGGKTGFTTQARHSYVGTAERDGRRIVVTILDAEAAPDRVWKQGGSLLDWGFSVSDSLAVGELVEPGEVEASAAAAAQTEAAASSQNQSDDVLTSLGTPQVIGIGIGILLAAVIVIAGSGVLASKSRRGLKTGLNPRRAQRQDRTAAGSERDLRAATPPPGRRVRTPRGGGSHSARARERRDPQHR